MACNYDTLSTTDNDSCIYALACDTCSGELDGSGVVVDNDMDDDGVCDIDELEGCKDSIACNFDTTFTTDINNDLCIYAFGCDTVLEKLMVLELL